MAVRNLSDIPKIYVYFTYVCLLGRYLYMFYSATTPESQITTNHIQVAYHFQINVPNAPNMPLNTRSKRPCEICSTTASNSNLVCSTTTHTLVTGHFQTNTENDPNMTLKSVMLKVAHVFSTSICEC